MQFAWEGDITDDRVGIRDLIELEGRYAIVQAAVAALRKRGAEKIEVDGIEQSDVPRLVPIVCEDCGHLFGAKRKSAKLCPKCKKYHASYEYRKEHEKDFMKKALARVHKCRRDTPAARKGYAG